MLRSVARLKEYGEVSAQSGRRVVVCDVTTSVCVHGRARRGIIDRRDDIDPRAHARPSPSEKPGAGSLAAVYVRRPRCCRGRRRHGRPAARRWPVLESPIGQPRGVHRH